MGWKEHSNPKYKPIKIQYIMHPHGLLKTNKNVIFFCSEYGIRIRVTRMKILYPRPLDELTIYYCKYRNLYFNYQIYLYKYIDKSIYCQGKKYSIEYLYPFIYAILVTTAPLP